MEGLWGLLGLPAPTYASLQSHDGDSLGVDFVSRSPDSQSVEDNVHRGHIDDSFTALLHEDHTLWMLRTMFECLEMTPNGSLFLTPPDKMPRRRTPPSPTEAEKQAQRARVNRQISQAVDDKRRAREAQADVLALFGATGLHEENILRAMEEEQRNARTKAIKRLRAQRVARFKSDLRRHIDAAGQVFDDSMAEDLEILDRVFAEDSETDDGDTAAVDEAATVAEVQLGPEEEGCDETRQREEGRGEEVETAADSIVQEDASVKGTEGPESEDDAVETSRLHEQRKQATREAKGKERVHEWEATIEAALLAAHRGDFDESKVAREHERRKTRFGSELAQQMRNLELKTDEMRRELEGVEGYAPFCPSCFRPIVAPCLCRLDDGSSDLATTSP